jgi:hypothetical protein
VTTRGSETPAWFQFIPNPSHDQRHTPAITPLKQITIRCVARLADHYEFWPVGHPHDAYKASLRPTRTSGTRSWPSCTQGSADGWTAAPWLVMNLSVCSFIQATE